MTLKIIGGATTRTMRAHWAAREMNLDYEVELIGSRSGATQKPEFLALSRKEKIPVLIHDDFVLTESAAIIHYLSALGDGSLVPTEIKARARYDEWLSFLLMELDAQFLYAIRKHRDLAHIYGEAPTAIDAARSGFEKYVPLVYRQLEPGRAYLLGDTFRGVDIVLTTVLEWALAYEFELAAIAQAYLERIQARDAYQSARKLNFSITPDQ
ncbi:MAG: glutathione S-transferase family protein [Pseudomonadota bacterium]